MGQQVDVFSPYYELNTSIFVDPFVSYKKDKGSIYRAGRIPPMTCFIFRYIKYGDRRLTALSHSNSSIFLTIMNDSNSMNVDILIMRTDEYVDT